MMLFNGHEWKLRRFGGASASRVSHLAGNVIGEHRHDWLNITIQLLGSCDEKADTGTFRLEGPSVTLLPAGSQHANRIGQHGLETIGLLIDPAWLGSVGRSLSPNRPVNFRGGKVGIAARRLAATWMSADVDEVELASATTLFLAQARDDDLLPEPPWLHWVQRAIDDNPSVSSEELAREVDLHPAWLARAYRHVVGEGLAETARRRRLERALTVVRHSALPLAQVAADAGFCDQSHMNRCFRAVLGMTPQRVRAFTTDASVGSAASRPRYRSTSSFSWVKLAQE